MTATFDSELTGGSTRQALGLIARFVRPNLGLSLLLLVLAVGTAALTAALPWLVAIAVDTGIPEAREARYGVLVAIGAGIGACGIALAVLNFVWRRQAGWLGQTIVFEMRRELFATFLKQPIRFYDQVPAGSLITRLTSDMEAANSLFGPTFARFLQIVVTTAVTVTAMLIMHAGLAAITFLALAPSVALTAWSLVELNGPFVRRRASLAKATAQVVEALDSVQVVQAFCQEPRNDLAFSGIIEPSRVAGRRIEFIRGIHYPLLTLIFGLSTVAIVAYGGYLVASGELQVGILSAFVLYMAQLFGPALGLVGVLDAAQRAMVSLAKVAEAIALVPAISSPPEASVPANASAGAIQFDNVTFSYDSAADSDPAVSDISFSIEPGETIALLGRTGAGKSTVAKLMARFYDPSSGRITLDGTDLRDFPDGELRKRILLLNQENFLFSGTISDNIRIGKPAATQREVEAAAEKLGIDHLIRALPEGFDTEVGKRGSRLSAGQRQIVSLAQAFLLDPAVLILDEATSALDLATERAIQVALLTMLKGRTGIIIAHRITTVEIAKRVLVVADGRLTDDRALSAALVADDFRQFFRE